jgi:sodium/hydrogen antiporter
MSIRITPAPPIVLGLVYLEHETHQPGEATIRFAVMTTVLCSIFAHGLSALAGMNLYARKLATLPPDAPEFDAQEAAARAESSDYS